LEEINKICSELFFLGHKIKDIPILFKILK